MLLGYFQFKGTESSLCMKIKALLPLLFWGKYAIILRGKNQESGIIANHTPTELEGAHTRSAQLCLCFSCPSGTSRVEPSKTKPLWYNLRSTRPSRLHTAAAPRDACWPQLHLLHPIRMWNGCKNSFPSTQSSSFHLMLQKKLSGFLEEKFLFNPLRKGPSMEVFLKSNGATSNRSTFVYQHLLAQNSRFLQTTLHWELQQCPIPASLHFSSSSIWKVRTWKFKVQ